MRIPSIAVAIACLVTATATASQDCDVPTRWILVTVIDAQTMNQEGAVADLAISGRRLVDVCEIIEVEEKNAGRVTWLWISEPTQLIRMAVTERIESICAAMDCVNVAAEGP